jgi:hypothetical protein
VTAYIALGALLTPQFLVGVFLLFAADQRNLALQWWSGRPLPFIRRKRDEDEDLWIGQVVRQSRAACRAWQVDTGADTGPGAREQRTRFRQTEQLAMTVSAAYDMAATLITVGALPLVAYDTAWLAAWALGHATALPMTPTAGLGGLGVTVALVIIGLRWYARQAERVEARAQQHIAFHTCTILLSHCWQLRRGSANDPGDLLPRFGTPAQLDLNVAVFLCDLGEWAVQGYPQLNAARLREVREHIARVQNSVHQAAGALLRGEPDALGQLVSVLAQVQSGLYRGTWLRGC